MVGNFTHNIVKIPSLNPNWCRRCLLRHSDIDFMPLVLRRQLELSIALS
jgi:hypothetical protein